MARRNTASNDIAEIEREIGRLLHDLETRVGRLNTLTRKTASQAANGAKDAANGASEYVSETLSDAADRLRDSASEAIERVQHGASAMSDEASRVGNDALHRLEDEIGNRPLLTLAIAAGIGFLAGMAGRRH
ncbi:MAG: hypothetical protein ACREDY_13330 [Bradyrhizobium sp.]